MMIQQILLPLVGSFLFLAVARAQRVEEVVRFNFRFGFFDDDETPKVDIMKEDVEGVICQTQYFLSQIVQNATNKKSIHAKATQIDWGYFEDLPMPAHINFTAEFTDAEVEGDVNWVDERILISEMEKLSEQQLQKFITDWVWKAEPINLNFFINSDSMAFDGIKEPPVTGVLEEAECPETEAPTHAPTTSAAPTAAPSLFDEDGSDTPPNATKPPNTKSPSDAGGPGGNGPPSRPGNATGGPSRANWPFGDNYDDISELDPMADFSLSFAMFENHEAPPSLLEVNALICEINTYFTIILRRRLVNSTIQMKAVYIDYFFDEGGAGTNEEDIKVNFTAFAYYAADKHDQVKKQDVFEALKLTPGELKTLVEEYVWKSEPEQENVFFHTESLAMNAGMGKEINTKAMLVEASGCVIPPNADGTPFAGIPSPDGSPSAIAGTTDPNLGLGGDAKQTEITVNFRVSNLEGIKEENAVKASGLSSSFPVFANEVVAATTQRDAARRQRRILRTQGRRLNVVPIPGTASVTDVQEYPCPDSALPGLTCHSARAKYDVLMSSDESTTGVDSAYTEQSERAANDGTYNSVLQRVDPKTPLYIGIMTRKDQIPPGSVERGYDGEPEDDGWFKWWYILILVLLLLLLCLCCLYCWLANKKDEPEVVTKETTVEEREVLVEEFDDEDQDRHGEEETEEFVDDPADQGIMVPYDPKGQPPPPPPPPAAVVGPSPSAGVLVPYDPDQKARDDAAERDRILSASQRGEQDKKKDDGEWEDDNN